MRKEMDLTAVITAHNEGLVAHKTMLSIFCALERLEKAGYSYEIIVHIDNGDNKTKSYFKRYEKDRRITIFDNHFGDLGSSRNYAARHSNGRLVAFLDGDDLISDNWFIEGVKMFEKHDDEFVVHPEAVLNFGFNQPSVLTIQKPSLGRDEDTILLVGENRWCSVVMAKRETFQKYPYYIKTPGCNYEDYVFNIETIEHEVRHRIAKNTVLFYRRSMDSMLSKGNAMFETIPPVSLFDFDKVKKIKTIINPKTFEENRKIKANNAYRRIRSNRIVNMFATPMALAVRKVTNKKLKVAKTIPDFVLKEWEKINSVETQLYPFQRIINSTQLYSAGGQIAVGNAYLEIANNVNGEADCVFIVPWIVRGGAEKVLLNYLSALHELYPKKRFTVITTLPSRNDWKSKVLDSVDVIEFGSVAKGLDDRQKMTLLTRVIQQLRPHRLHIINSEFGYRWAMCHQDLIRSNYKLTTSLFCYEFIPESNLAARFSYDDPYLLTIYNVVDKVFTDNENVISESVAKNGFDRDKFAVHYQPIAISRESKKEEFKDGKMHILWASRVASQKMPTLLAEIGKRIDSKKCIIDVYGEMSKEINGSIFVGIKGIQYHGAYNGFDILMKKKYDCYLYTSSIDGIPNTILEAASHGLPIIASDVGGVGEIIQNKKTGILVKESLSVDEYVKAIKWANDNCEEMNKYAENAKTLIEERHSWRHFLELVKKDFKIEE